MQKPFVSFLRKDGAHLLLLLLGAGLFIGGCFQNSLWFDEAYTVGLMQHSLPDVLRWATYDVHPHLYYILLKLFTLLFGSSLPVMRLFSALGGILFASLGYTHLRRNFGKAVGFWFSFCAIFCAQTLAYALAIRMYTWAAFFVAAAAIYAYRMTIDPAKRHNRVLFLVFALCAAYTHYFGLFAAGMMQLFLLFRAFRRKKGYLFWLVNSAILLAAYLPGLLVMKLQAGLGGAAWLSLEWPDTLFELTSYPFLGDVLKYFVVRTQDGAITPAFWIAGSAFAALWCAGGLLFWQQIRNARIAGEKRNAALAALFCCFGAILFTLAVSLHRPIWYARYSVPLSGLLFFAMACLFASFRKRLSKLLAAALLLAIFGHQVHYYYSMCYDPSGDAVTETLAPCMQPEDTFLFDNATTFCVIVCFPEQDAYFLNAGGWNVQDTYRAFGPNSRVIDELTEVTEAQLGGRVWTNGRGSCYQYLLSLGYAESDSHSIRMRYHNCHYEMILMVQSPASQ